MFDTMLASLPYVMLVAAILIFAIPAVFTRRKGPVIFVFILNMLFNIGAATYDFYVGVSWCATIHVGIAALMVGWLAATIAETKKHKAEPKTPAVPESEPSTYEALEKAKNRKAKAADRKAAADAEASAAADELAQAEEEEVLAEAKVADESLNELEREALSRKKNLAEAVEAYNASQKRRDDAENRAYRVKSKAALIRAQRDLEKAEKELARAADDRDAAQEAYDKARSAATKAQGIVEGFEEPKADPKAGDPKAAAKAGDPKATAKAGDPKADPKAAPKATAKAGDPKADPKAAPKATGKAGDPQTAAKANPKKPASPKKPANPKITGKADPKTAAQEMTSELASEVATMSEVLAHANGTAPYGEYLYQLDADTAIILVDEGPLDAGIDEVCRKGHVKASGREVTFLLKDGKVDRVID